MHSNQSNGRRTSERNKEWICRRRKKKRKRCEREKISRVDGRVELTFLQEEKTDRYAKVTLRESMQHGDDETVDICVVGEML